MAIRRVNTPPPSSSSTRAEEAPAPPSRIRPVARPGAPNAEPGPPSGTEGEEYKVGKGRPPLHTRFRKGQSGNPKGRPPGAKGLKKLVRENLLAKVSMRTEDGVRKVTRIEAIILKQLEQAVKGNQRAASQLINLYAAAVPDQPEQEVGQTAENLTAADETILALYREQILGQQGDER